MKKKKNGSAERYILLILALYRDWDRRINRPGQAAYITTTCRTNKREREGTRKEMKANFPMRQEQQ